MYNLKYNLFECAFASSQGEYIKKEREILLTLVFSCLVIDLHGLMVVTLRAMQHA